MSDPSVQQVLLSLSPLDAAVLTVGAIGATALHFTRQANGRQTQPGEWVRNALDICTILIIALACVNAVFGNVFGLPLSELTEANGLIIAAALLNCMIIIGKGLLASVKPVGRYGAR